MRKTLYSTLLILLIGLSAIGAVFAEEPIINATADKSVNDQKVNLGDPVDFTLTVSNPNEDDNFTDVVVTDKISDLLKYVGNSDPSKATYDSNTKTVTWNIGDLDAGESAELIIYTEAIATGTFNNEFEGTYNVKVEDKPAYYTEEIVGYDKVITGWVQYPEGYFWGTYQEVDDWLASMQVEHPDAELYGPYKDIETCCCWFAWICIPEYCYDPIYELVYHPATYKEETRDLYAVIDPGIIIGPENPEEVSAATVDMEKTGAPIVGTILALLMVTAGLFLAKRKP